MSQAEATVSITNPIQRSRNSSSCCCAARAFIALFVLVIVFSILSPTFLTPANIVIMSKHVAINAILGIGMTFVILTGGIDLSVGSLVGLCAMIAGGLINEGIILQTFGVVVYPHVWTIMLMTLGAGVLMGGISGSDHHPLQRGALHRHIGHALCGARHGPVALQRQYLRQPGGS